VTTAPLISSIARKCAQMRAHAFIESFSAFDRNWEIMMLKQVWISMNEPSLFHKLDEKDSCRARVLDCKLSNSRDITPSVQIDLIF